MNLKESFRYQKFLDRLMQNAAYSVQNRVHAYRVTKTHLRSRTNPEAQDKMETIEAAEPFFPNDQVIAFMQRLIEEKRKLSEAIGKAKAGAEFDIDAAVETNKFNRMAAESVKTMLRNVAYKAISKENDYKFDVNGAQVTYYYDVEVVGEEAYDRESARTIMRDIVMKADEVSAQVDAALVNTNVEYNPPFNVNDSFDDVMESLGYKPVVS